MELITTHTGTDLDGLAAMVAARLLHPGARLALPGALAEKTCTYLAQELDTLQLFSQAKAIPLTEVRRLILVDTRQAGRLGPFAACLAAPGLSLVSYDHHPAHADDIQAQEEHSAPVAATTTLMVSILRERNIRLKPWEATLLILGVYDNSGGLLGPATTAEDLQAAAWLLKQGADLEQVSRYFSRALSEKQNALVAQLQKNCRAYEIHGQRLMLTRLTTELYIDDALFLLRRVMAMEGVEALFAFALLRGQLFLFCRSIIPEINAGSVARLFGGGGNATEATARIVDLERSEAEERLLAFLQTSVRPRERAGELMSHPAVAMAKDLSITEAAQLLTRYNFTVLPVVEQAAGARGEPPRGLLGMISRSVVEKAIFHKLGQEPVGEYMTTGIATLSEDAGLAEILGLIVARRQRLIPVLRGDALVGVITRTDLLALLLNDPGNVSPELLRADTHPSAKRGRNLSELMVRRLPKETIVLLREIGETAASQGFQAFVAGGFVRDLLLNHKNMDIDIVVEGDGVAFAQALAKARGGQVHPHLKFNTATIALPDGLKLDVASARLEYYHHPVALPTVEQGSIKRDLQRRDFTINAMAIHLNPQRFGELADFYNSQNDLIERRLQVLHNLSFVEDPTRIYRAIRFEARLGFRISANTERLIKSAVRLGLPRRIDGPRLLHELQQLFSEDDPVPPLRRLAEFGLIGFLSPDPPGFRVTRRLRHALRTGKAALACYYGEAREQAAKAPIVPWLVYMLVLGCGQSLLYLNAFYGRLDIPEKQRQFLLNQKRKAEEAHYALFRRPNLRPSESYWLFREMADEGLLYLCAIARKRHIQERVADYLRRLRHLRPLLDGADLKALGYRPGPHFSVMQRALIVAQLDGKIREREEAKALLLSRFPLDKQPPRRTR